MSKYCSKCFDGMMQQVQALGPGFGAKAYEHLEMEPIWAENTGEAPRTSSRDLGRDMKHQQSRVAQRD